MLLSCWTTKRREVLGAGTGTLMDGVGVSSVLVSVGLRLVTGDDGPSLPGNNAFFDSIFRGPRPAEVATEIMPEINETHTSHIQVNL